MTERPSTASEPPHPELDASPAKTTAARTPKRNRLRTAVWIVLSVLVLAMAGFFGLGLYAQRVVSQYPGFASAGTTDTTPIPIHIGGRNYNVPANYLHGSANQEGKQEALLLLALWPGLEGRTKENLSQLMVGHPGQKIRVLLQTARSEIPAIRGVEIALKNRMRMEEPFEYRGQVDGLEHHVPVDGHTMIGRYEYMIEKNEDGVEHFLRCRPDDIVPFPSCSH